MSDDLSELYQQVILDHSRKPRNFHVLPDANRSAEATIRCAAIISPFFSSWKTTSSRTSAFKVRAAPFPRRPLP